MGETIGPSPEEMGIDEKSPESPRGIIEQETEKYFAEIRERSKSSADNPDMIVKNAGFEEPRIFAYEEAIAQGRYFDEIKFEGREDSGKTRTNTEKSPYDFFQAVIASDKFFEEKFKKSNPEESKRRAQMAERAQAVADAMGKLKSPGMTTAEIETAKERMKNINIK